MEVAGFHFSLCEVIQKGPNLANGARLQSSVHQQLKLQLETVVVANRKVNFSHQKQQKSPGELLITANYRMKIHLLNTIHTEKIR